jgi:hypothetical protein
MANDGEGSKSRDSDTEDAAGSSSADAPKTIGIGEVTPRNFVRWALQRFPKGRLFR